MGVAFVRAPSEDASEESKGDVRRTAGKKEPGAHTKYTPTDNHSIRRFVHRFLISGLRHVYSLHDTRNRLATNIMKGTSDSLHVLPT